MPPKKSKNPPNKKQRLLCDVGAPGAITITSKYDKYKGAELLMTDSIYGNKLPMEALLNLPKIGRLSSLAT